MSKLPGHFRDTFAAALAKHTDRVGDCVVWRAACSGGLPLLSYTADDGSKSSVSVRRTVWQMHRGPVDSKSYVVPTCSTPRCVALAHLQITDRSTFRTRTNESTGRCRSGRHDLTDETNVRRDRDGRRNGCVPCLREKQRAYSDAERDDGRLAARQAAARERRMRPDVPA